MEIVWKCPECDYYITDLERERMVADLGCPRCKRPLRRFVVEGIMTDRPRRDKADWWKNGGV